MHPVSHVYKLLSHPYENKPSQLHVFVHLVHNVPLSYFFRRTEMLDTENVYIIVYITL